MLLRSLSLLVFLPERTKYLQKEYGEVGSVETETITRPPRQCFQAESVKEGNGEEERVDLVFFATFTFFGVACSFY